ncbi:basic proline-rich protein-like [Bos indicus]|uniref:Basic proline-rich protein-like n=1 Tax=Bos indicus TaxID=9915 RepID=A0ABM4SKQ2_BOSIN
MTSGGSGGGLAAEGPGAPAGGAAVAPGPPPQPGPSGKPPPGSVSAGPAQACTPVNLAGSAYSNARAGSEPLPVRDIRGPHPPCSPKNKAGRRPAPGPPTVRCQEARHPCPSDPQPASPPHRGISARPPPGGPQLAWDFWVCPLWSGGLVLRGPLSGKARHREAARASPPPFPSRRNNGGPGCRGRGARPPAASRCARGLRRVPLPPRPAAPPPRGRPPPRSRPGPARRPRSPRFGAAALFPPLLSKTRPEKPPEPRGAGTGNCILAAPGLGGGSPGRGQGEGTAGLRRRLEPAAAASHPPARLSVSVTCPRSPPPPPPPTSRLLPGGGSSRGRVCPEASRQAHQDVSAQKAKLQQAQEGGYSLGSPPEAFGVQPYSDPFEEALRPAKLPTASSRGQQTPEPSGCRSALALNSLFLLAAEDSA